MPLYQLGPFKLPDPNDPKWSKLTEIGDTERTHYEFSGGNRITVSLNFGRGTSSIEVNGTDLGSHVKKCDYDKYAEAVYNAVYNREERARFDYIQDKLKDLKDE